MKAGSQFVLLVLMALGLNDVKEVTPDRITEETVRILQEEMTSYADIAFVQLCKEADETGEPMYFDSTHIWWKLSGFDDMDKSARIVFRRIQEHFGREMCFEKDSMVVFPHLKTKKVLAS